MSEAIKLFSRPCPSPAGEYLGPARVTEGGARRVRVALPSGFDVQATLALAYPYAPAVDDTLLVIGRGGEHYVIGVIEGTGQLSMAFAGDVNLHATGALTLSADAGVKLRGPKVELVTGRLKVVAEQAVQRFSTVVQRVRELLSVHAGQTRTVIDGDAVQRARRTTILSAETTTVDGQTILIG